MSRDRGQVQRRLMGLVVDGEETLPSGTKFMGGEKEAGQTTSSVWSPKLESVIALAYIRRNFQDAESLQTEDGRQTKVVELPFV